MKEQEKYSRYSFEDFIHDDFFVESIKRPTDESISFWNLFLENHPEQSENYHTARLCVENVSRPRISDKEVAAMWANIRKKLKPVLKSENRRRLIYYAAAAAASIALLWNIRLFFTQHNDLPVRNDVMTFVSNADTISNNGEIQLIISEEKTVYLQDKESVITYDSTGIHTGSEKLAKNEVASYNQLIVPYGKSSVLTLHDGTTIWVNAGTRLVYPAEFEADKREIYVNGEIFLDVSSDAKRPFIVRTNDFRIQVVGTRFNVQAYMKDEQSRIALVEGSVKISTETAEEVMLKPNQVFEQDKGGHSTVKDADVEKYTSWIHGQYIYESECLGVILKRLERYYGKEIVVGPSVSELECAGKLNLKENIEDVLSIISKTAPVEYIKDGERYNVNFLTLK